MKRIMGKKLRAEEEKRHKGSLTPPPLVYGVISPKMLPKPFSAKINKYIPNFYSGQKQPRIFGYFCHFQK
jgi:hypothetical protein